MKNIAIVTDRSTVGLLEAMLLDMKLSVEDNEITIFYNELTDEEAVKYDEVIVLEYKEDVVEYLTDNYLEEILNSNILNIIMVIGEAYSEYGCSELQDLYHKTYRGLRRLLYSKGILDTDMKTFRINILSLSLYSKEDIIKKCLEKFNQMEKEIAKIDFDKILVPHTGEGFSFFKYKACYIISRSDLPENIEDGDIVYYLEKKVDRDAVFRIVD